VSANPYAPPTALVDDVPTAQSTASGYFYSSSLVRLALLSVCTMGFFQLYWFYKNWQLIRLHEQPKISPAARTVFAILYGFSALAAIRRRGEVMGIKPRLHSILCAGAWTALTVASRLPPPYVLISVLSVVFLLPAQAHANRINLAAAGVEPNGRFGAWGWLALATGGPVMLLAVIGSFSLK
jgi:hypothetical protein